MRPVVYISSPISNGGTLTLDQQKRNIAPALEAATYLMRKGFSVICPALTVYWDEYAGQHGGNFSHDEWMAADKAILLKCDYVLRIPGESKGADQEVRWAKEAGIPVYYSAKLLPIAKAFDENTISVEAWRKHLPLVGEAGPETITPGVAGEVRVTNPTTGGAKGKKLARFSSIPPDVMWELAEHYGKGEAKYPDASGHPNWQRGYDWYLNVDALERHLNLWKQGEDIDAETGSHHLIAVLWHAIALRWFQLHDKGTDYRSP